jgi:hypothetical protein
VAVIPVASSTAQVRRPTFAFVGVTESPASDRSSPRPTHPKPGDPQPSGAGNPNRSARRTLPAGPGGLIGRAGSRRWS